MKDKNKMNPKQIEEGVRLILEGIGENPDSQRLKGTPRRVAQMFEEVLAGTHKDPDDFLKALNEEEHEEMVMLKDIPLYSMCEHHMLPFPARPALPISPGKARSWGLILSPCWWIRWPSASNCKNG